MIIPEDEAFVTGVTPSLPGRPGKPILSDFLPSDDLAEMGENIIRGTLPKLDDGALRIDYRWKRKGGTSGGSLITGKCVKLSGAAKHYAKGAHFLIWLAADHCYYEGYDDSQLAKLLYHELLHVTRDETVKKDGTIVVTYGTRGHDVEMFYEDLRDGAWNRSLDHLVQTVQQLRLPMEIGAQPEPVGV